MEKMHGWRVWQSYRAPGVAHETFNSTNGIGAAAGQGSDSAQLGRTEKKPLSKLFVAATA